MKLTKGKRQTLYCDIASMLFTKIVDKLKIDSSKGWRRGERIQNEYHAIHDKDRKIKYPNNKEYGDPRYFGLPLLLSENQPFHGWIFIIVALLQ